MIKESQIANFITLIRRFNHDKKQAMAEGKFKTSPLKPAHEEREHRSPSTKVISITPRHKRSLRIKTDCQVKETVETPRTPVRINKYEAYCEEMEKKWSHRRNQSTDHKSHLNRNIPVLYEAKKKDDSNSIISLFCSPPDGTMWVAHYQSAGKRIYTQEAPSHIKTTIQTPKGGSNRRQSQRILPGLIKKVNSQFPTQKTLLIKHFPLLTASSNNEPTTQPLNQMASLQQPTETYSIQSKSMPPKLRRVDGKFKRNRLLKLNCQAKPNDEEKIEGWEGKQEEEREISSRLF